MHRCEIQNNGIHDLIWETEIEAQTQRANGWTPREEGGGWDRMGFELEGNPEKRKSRKEEIQVCV